MNSRPRYFNPLIIVHILELEPHFMWIRMVETRMRQGNRFFIVLMAFATASANAAVWSNFSVSYLNGSHYEVGDSDRQVITLEHAAKLHWGNTFTFVDRLEYDDGSNETYGEIGARFQISRMENSFVQRVYLAGQVEMGTLSNSDGSGFSFTNYLVGIGSG